MKQKLQKIAFYYFVISSVAAYLVTAISLIANQNWYEYFVSPVYLYCHLLYAGIKLKMPGEIILSILPLLFICVSCVLNFLKNEYSSLFLRPILLGSAIISAFLMIILIFLSTGNGSFAGSGIVFLLSVILNLALPIILFHHNTGDS